MSYFSVALVFYLTLRIFPSTFSATVEFKPYSHSNENELPFIQTPGHPTRKEHFEERYIQGRTNWWPWIKGSTEGNAREPTEMLLIST